MTKKYSSIEEKLAANSVVEGECWIWIGRRNSSGYGRLNLWDKELKKSYTVYAHREAYRLAKGYITKGEEIHHICKNRLCINPEHLELVSHKENCSPTNRKNGRRKYE